MPRRPTPIHPNDPYHISARCINREWFQLPLDTVWAIMEDHLYLLANGFGVQIHSFVLMSNHFHMIVTAPQGNLSEALLYFMRETSREIARLSGRINQTYGIRNHKTHIASYHYFLNSYKYIYQNPLRAGVCERVEDYPYSTLHGLCGARRSLIPVVEDTILFCPGFSESALKWLNSKPNPQQNEEMRIALKRPQFVLGTSRKTGRTSILERCLL